MEKQLQSSNPAPGSGGGAEGQGKTRCCGTCWQGRRPSRQCWQLAVFLYHIHRQGSNIPAQSQIKTQGAGRPISSRVGQLQLFAERNPGPVAVCPCQHPTRKEEAGGSQAEGARPWAPAPCVKRHGHLVTCQLQLSLGRGGWRPLGGPCIPALGLP